MGFGDDHIPHKRRKDQIVTEKMIPVIIGYDQHVMAKATIEQTAKTQLPDGTPVPAKVEIVIVAEGEHAQYLGDFVAANEIVALSFGGVPVRPVRKEN